MHDLNLFLGVMAVAAMMNLALGAFAWLCWTIYKISKKLQRVK